MQKQEQLTDNLDQIVKEDFILDASLYDGEGKLLAQSRENCAISSMVKQSTNCRATLRPKRH